MNAADVRKTKLRNGIFELGKSKMQNVLGKHVHKHKRAFDESTDSIKELENIHFTDYSNSQLMMPWFPF